MGSFIKGTITTDTYVSVQSSLIDDGLIGDIKGIELWSSSVWQGGLDTNKSDIDGGRGCYGRTGRDSPI